MKDDIAYIIDTILFAARERKILKHEVTRHESFEQAIAYLLGIKTHDNFVGYAIYEARLLASSKDYTILPES